MINYIKKYDKLANEYINKYFPNSTPMNSQKKGSAADFILETGEVAEVKIDRKATETGNLFIEHTYVKDEIRESSGIMLSAIKNYTIIIIIPYIDKDETIIKVKAKDLINFCISNKIKERNTLPYSNGNRRNVGSIGYILPINKIPQEWRFK